jgi:hypothetical protein
MSPVQDESGGAETCRGLEQATDSSLKNVGLRPSLGLERNYYDSKNSKKYDSKMAYTGGFDR